MPQTVRVQVLYWEETAKGRFQSALYYTLDEYPNIKQEDIDAEKQKRIDNWLAIVSAPSIEPTKEDYERNVAEAQKSIALMQSDIAEFSAKIAEIDAKTIAES